MREGAGTFHEHFVAELRREGFTAAQMRQWLWKPYRVEDLRLAGPGRDPDLTRLEPDAADLEALLARVAPSPVDREFYRRQKLVLVLVPGFTHETLRNLSWHEQIERRDSPHHVVMLRPGGNGEPPQEDTYAQGDGLKLLYVRYPRSNAASEHILQPMFDMLHRSATLRRWVLEEGRKLFFVGYSYGSPLSLELLAGLNSGRFADDYLLNNAVGFLGMCGDIGGSYLADEVMKPDSRFLSIPRLVAFCRRHPWIGKLVGLGTPQLRDDMEDGVRSLGHAQRRARMRLYAPRLPAQLRYFSVSAVLPLADYRRHWWQCNLDDYALWRQARISEPVTVYNDGQVTLDDNLVPPGPPRHTHLGAVRTHHWGVSYRTFNFGINRFPRPAFYRALLRTIVEQLEEG